MIKPGDRSFELLLLAALAFLWGSSYLLTRVAVETMTPLTLLAVFVLFVMRGPGITAAQGRADLASAAGADVF